MEKKQPQSIRNQRRPKGFISTFTLNFLHLRKPWVVTWWSAAFPGFGAISCGSYIIGFILVAWEFVINLKAHLNLAILYSLTGRFSMAKEVLDTNWFLFYIVVYIFAIWRTYCLVVELNKLSILAGREDSTILPVKIDSLEINFIDKRVPWVAVSLSMLSPGLGHLYTHRIPTGFFLLAEYIGVAYFSHLLPAIHYVALGAFSKATSILDPQWLLFLPSLYGFAVYDSYVNTVEYNKLFEQEQSRFLMDNYQSPDIFRSLVEEFGG